METQNSFSRQSFRFSTNPRGLGALTRRILAGLLYFPGRARLQRMIAAGLPQSLVAPLEFLLSERITPEARGLAARIESLRAAVARRGADTVSLFSTDPTKPAARAFDDDPLPDRLSLSWTRVAEVASVPAYWGMFLHLCAQNARARAILELGSCIGISGCYLAASPHCETFITVEGSEILAQLAQENLRAIAPRARVVNALFEAALDSILPTLTAPLDLVHIDGHHEKHATLHYLDRVAPHLARGSIVIFDDIYWTPEMCAAWRIVRARRGVNCAIDLGRCGVIVWDGESIHGRCWDFSRFAGYWGKGRH